MYFTTTNGQQIFIPDMCQFCDMKTGGGHQYNCPLYPHERYEIRIVFFTELGNEVEEGRGNVPIYNEGGHSNEEEKK